MTKSLLESTLRHHLFTCLRTGGYPLRDRVQTPPKNFPIHVCDFDMLDTEDAEDQTGELVTLQPGCWVYSQESGQEDQWDVNNLCSIWLLEGRPDTWEYLSQHGIIEPGTNETHLLGFIGQADGMVHWSFTIPRQMHVNEESEVLSCYAEAGFKPGPQDQVYMHMDMQIVGMFVAHMSRGDLPPPKYSVEDFMILGAAPLIDEVMGVHHATPQRIKENGLLVVPPAVRTHIDRTLGERVFKFPYHHVSREHDLPILGVRHRDQDEVAIRVLDKSSAVAKFKPGCWVTAPLDPEDTWPLHSLVTFTFLKMQPAFWTDKLPDSHLLCLVSTASGPRAWYYHVPVSFDLCSDDGKVVDVVCDGGVDLLAFQDVINMDLAMISRIGYLVAENHPFMQWGECQMERPEAETPVNWMHAILNQRNLRGF